ncbi:MAG: hypothetical protein AAGH87_05095 [Pseudomonadota bacterium]
MTERVAQGEWSVTRRQSLVRERAEIDLRLVGALLLIAAAATLLRPPYAFSIDDMIYVEMARAIWENGALHIAERGGVTGSPELIIKLTHAMDGRVYPQYPAFYGVVAAPFYGLAGVRGLVFLNMASLFAVLWLSQRIVRHLYGVALDRRFVAGLLAAATFLPVYGLGIWPHMLGLAFVMAGVERATSHLSDRSSPDPLRLILSGLWFGAAMTVRVDSFLPALATVFWLALFGAPTRRAGPVWMIFGMLPFLAMASLLNLEKFGVFTPITYGPKTGSDGVANYLPHFVAAGGALLAAIWLNPAGARASVLFAKLKSTPAILAVLSALGAVVWAVPDLRAIAWNAVVLVGDLQLMDQDQISGATERGTDGLISILGVHKKALLQSVPWFVLSAVALGGLLFGQRVAARGLCFLVSAAVIGFYSLTQWHGGYSHNMRYFLPALPFLAILSVDGLTSLCRGVSARQRRAGLTSGGIMGVLTIATVWLSALPSGVTFLYPTLCIAGAVLLTSFALSAARRQPWLKRAWLITAGAAISMASLASLADLWGQFERTGEFGALTETAARTIPPRSLVVTDIEEHFLKSPAAGVHLVSASRNDGQVARAALAAFRAEGRCVYVHTADTYERLALDGDWVRVRLPGLQSERAELVQPRHQSVRCALDPQ